MKLKLLAVLIIIICEPALPQNKQEADSLYTSQNWEEAALAYEQYLQNNPSDSAAWFSLGLSYMHLKGLEKASKVL